MGRSFVAAAVIFPAAAAAAAFLCAAAFHAGYFIFHGGERERFFLFPLVHYLLKLKVRRR